MSALVPWRPMREMDTLSRRMDDMFDRLTRDFFGAGWVERPRAEAAMRWEPAIECHLEAGNLIVKADLPGIDPKDVNVSVLGTQLTIEGERKREKTEEGEGYMYRELPYGKFARVLTLPEGIDADKVKTAYKNGVLEISMPMPPQMVSKKIPIEVRK
jgi:HSP20 family protein